ncbi:hypothetical protein [Fulvimarina sp. MAC3]|uniref:hypothetical protein n=1 Tax=Fulvimarina sp. MAC3 TaxID=3148887 RepID=UPI0031FE23EB
MQAKTLLRQLEEKGLGLLPMLEEIESDETRHAIREFISTVQAVRILTEKFSEKEPSAATDAARRQNNSAIVA